MRINSPTHIYIHTTDANFNKIPKQFFAVDSWHKERFGEYCRSSLGYYGGYHTLIEPDGKEFRYREDEEEACAAQGWNTSSLNVAMAFDGDEQLPTSQQVAILKKRLKKWIDKFHIPVDNIHIAPHRAVSPSKTCYGSLLSDEWAWRLVQPVIKEEEQQKKKVAIENNSRLLLQIKILQLQIKILLARLGLKFLNKRPLK